MLTYAAITPARDEAEGIARLAECLIRQTVRPLAWIVVDDGSTDGTPEVVASFAAQHEWIRLAVSPGTTSREGHLREGRGSGRDVIAFNAGVRTLPIRPDIVCKLDADVSFDEDFFESLLSEFEADAQLGIAGGTCHELTAGRWRPQHVTGHHVRGATRAYRWQCLEDVSPLLERLGWDGVDEARAALRGWQTRSLDKPFFHHRRVGQRDGAWRAFELQGATSRYMGYRLSYLILRTLHRARRDPAASAMVVGWLKASWRREPTLDDPQVRSYFRSQQSLRKLPYRIAEALGRRRGTNGAPSTLGSEVDQP